MRDSLRGAEGWKQPPRQRKHSLSQPAKSSMRCHGVCNISYLFREAQRQDRALIALNIQNNV